MPDDLVHVWSPCIVQVAVVANHQNGRDTHVREIRVFGQQADSIQAMIGLPLGVTSTQMGMYTSIR
jgi:anaphase-promoting complex subunit 10